MSESGPSSNGALYRFRYGSAALVDALDPVQLAAGSPGEEWPARVEALRA